MTQERTPLKFPLHIPYVEALGMQLWRFADGVAEVRLEVRPEMTNSWAVAHGGIVMTLLDVVMAHAARSVQEPEVRDGAGIATIEMKTSFMRPANGRLVATGQLLHGTGRMAFCEGRVLDESGALCAHATGTFRFIGKRRDDAPADAN